ncbi:uncharacterized protein LOC8260382 [Ricinus communis]|uniref:Uncharacterized protein n=1 Tax=Ricinus communis TaxID=3988 RepID=B9SLX8_RICCO|nr:uncharacterized protein LOC8260382 [Ricinus communis]EEF35369.1 conserved hypothetical protein [Ricinus communis]|eukprot:XP_002526997.1 uncharacterized protein LOC8260382 [Ricinus communis]
MLKQKVPIFRKVSNMLRMSIFVSKMRKPVIPKLILFLKKSRKLKRSKFLLLDEYRNRNNYGFLHDYEFSPSSTPPLLFHCRKKMQFKKYGSYKDSIYSMFFMCRCSGGLKGGEVALPLETVVPSASAIIHAGDYLQPLDLWDEEESVDQKAERFIERFYQEMRMQRQESI